MRIRCICPCGLENQNMQDWLAHWKDGIKRKDKFLGNYPKLRAIWMFLNTDIRFN